MCICFVFFLKSLPKISFASFTFFLFKLINLFLAVLGLCCCMRAFSSCGEQGLLFVVEHGL